MGKINSISDLPAWFDLEKYNGCESFGAADWLEQLSRRRRLFAGIPDSSINNHHRRTATPEDEFSIEIWRAVNADRLKSLREKPMLKEGFSARVSPVAPLWMLDLVEQKNNDEIAHKSSNNRVVKVERWQAFSDDGYAVRSVKNLLHAFELDSYDGKPPLSVVTVDLRANDSQLIAAFSAWLKEAREKQSLANKREKAPYKKWAGFGLLPYLDLLLWSIEADKQIPHHLMAEKVGYIKGGDSFRKTVPKLAWDLMSDLGELMALAAIEDTSEQLAY